MLFMLQAMRWVTMMAWPSPPKTATTTSVRQIVQRSVKVPGGSKTVPSSP